MGFWSPALNKINGVIADLYPIREDSERIVESAGLDLKDIDFRNRAIDNWHVILREAKKRNKIKELIEFAINDSQNQDLADAYKEYLNTSGWLGGGASFLPVFLERFRNFLKRHAGAAMAAISGSIVVIIIALVIYFFFWPTYFSGYISCDGSTARAGERLPGVTVVIPNTDLKAVTDKEGLFVINNVPRYKKVPTLEARYGYKPYFIQLKDFLNNDYRIIPCPVDRQPVIHEIPPEWWKETSMDEADVIVDCQTGEGVSQVKLYTLTPDPPITKTEPGDKLFVVVKLPSEGKIVSSDVAKPDTEPPSYEEKLLPETTRDKVRSWQIQMPGREIVIRLQLCLGAPSEVSASLLGGYYYFE